jgi:predicted enzyme related to lactoylglutathione lyase
MEFNSILIGSEHPEGLVAFYRGLFGDPAWEDGGYTGWQLGPAGVMIGPHDEVKGANGEPGRFIWNLTTTDVPGDFARFTAAGATVVAEPYHPGDVAEVWIATLADPDGNYFQLTSPMP